MRKTVELDDHSIEVERLDKVFFPGIGLTKGDLIAYYRRIAATMLPHLEGRPLTMQRFPDGIGEKGFYQADFQEIGHSLEGPRRKLENLED